jgi:hypothetical protein
MEDIPLPADSINVVISNHVINLSVNAPGGVDRDRARSNAGGRVGISDVVAEDRLRPDERAERGSYPGCVAGALSKGKYEAGLEAAGFEQVSVEFTHQVADGMQRAIVRAVKRRAPEANGLPGHPARDERRPLLSSKASSARSAAGDSSRTWKYTQTAPIADRATMPLRNAHESPHIVALSCRCDLGAGVPRARGLSSRSTARPSRSGIGISRRKALAQE